MTDSPMRDEHTTVAQLRGLLTKFVAERDWHVYHDAKNLSMSIAIEAAELMEHFQWVRNEDVAALRADGAKLADVREELADVVAYALALANVLELDLSSAIQDKMRKNEQKYPAERFRGVWYKPKG